MIQHTGKICNQQQQNISTWCQHNSLKHPSQPWCISSSPACWWIFHQFFQHPHQQNHRHQRSFFPQLCCTVSVGNLSDCVQIYLNHHPLVVVSVNNKHELSINKIQKSKPYQYDKLISIVLAHYLKQQQICQAQHNIIAIFIVFFIDDLITITKSIHIRLVKYKIRQWAAIDF